MFLFAPNGGFVTPLSANGLHRPLFFDAWERFYLPCIVFPREFWPLLWEPVFCAPQFTPVLPRLRALPLAGPTSSRCPCGGVEFVPPGLSCHGCVLWCSVRTPLKPPLKGGGPKQIRAETHRLFQTPLRGTSTLLSIWGTLSRFSKKGSNVTSATG